MPDRPPLFDLIRNDAVIGHFAGEPLTLKNAAEVVPRAMRRMLDATRPLVRLPEEPRTEIGEDGRKTVYERWTEWREHKTYASSREYAEAHCRKPGKTWEWDDSDMTGMRDWIASQQETAAQLGEVVLFCTSIAKPGFLRLYSEVGLEAFSYYLADCPEAICDAMERNTVHGEQFIEHIPEQICRTAVFLGEDIAFGNGPLCSPAWLRKEFFPRLKRITTAWHKRGTKVLFHSDGNVMSLLDDLVEAGIDGLNPIEIAAGMNIAEIHRRYPHLFMAGGIDVSEHLVKDTPQQVRDMTVKAIEDAGGRLMVGSSTEIHDDVPLENYMAMREAVLDYKY